MPDERRGILYGVAAYAIWGLFPLYWPLLKPADAVEILAHRMVWSLLVVAAILAVLRRWSWIRGLIAQPRKLGLLSLAALCITVNWGTYIYAVNIGHVVEAALGYFITPLVNVLFGVALFHERLRRWQWVAVGLGAVAVVVLTVGYGRVPWLALVLAFSFGTYALIKKSVNIGATESLAIETLVLFLPALAYLGVLEATGSATFGHHGAGHALLLAGAGVVTAIPLLFFGASAIRVPMTVMGLLQYIAPVLQFLVGVFIVHETMPAARWIGFVIVWLALAVFTWDQLRAGHTARLAQRRAEAHEPVGA